MSTPKHEQDDPKAHFRAGRMTRAGMVHAIEQGGAVIHNGKHYSKVADLPSEAEMAEGDSAAAAALKDSLDAQMAALAAQRAQADATLSRAREADAARAKAESEKKDADKAEAEKSQPAPAAKK